MAEFFLSVPGALAIAGLGFLLLSRRGGPRRATRALPNESNVRLIMQIAVSIVMLAAGLWVMLSGHYGDEATRWAAGTIGTVVGYWLKP
jgi:hypothetical protein